MNKKIVILLIILTILLSGCWDSREAQRLFYIYGIGVDYKDGKYEMYAQIISFANIAKSEQPANPDTIQAEVGYASGKTEHEAFYNLYKSLDEELYWGHLSYIVFSEEAIKSGKMNSFVNSFIRFLNTRYQTWVYSTQESVKDVMLVTPILNKAISLSKLSDPLNSYRQDSAIEPMSIRKLILRLDEPSHEVNVPLVTLTQNWETIKGKNPTTNINGVSVVTPRDLKGNISGDDINGLRWFNKKNKKVELQLTGNLAANGKVDAVKVTPIVKNNNVKFDINLKIEVDLSGFHGTVKESNLRKEVAKEIQKEIKDTFAVGLSMDADIYRLSEYLYRKDVKTWSKLQKGGKIELNENSIRKINVEIVSVHSGRKNFNEVIKR
ncbi:Ger(x)C family spore germination protein [Rummeliibacillus sp. JY-2-4R]